MECSECYCCKEIQCSFHVEEPYEKSSASPIQRHSRNCGQSEQSCNQIAECRGISELRMHACIDSSWGKKHQPDAPEGVEQKNRKQYGLKFKSVEPGQHVDPGCNPKYKGAEEQIYCENVHGATVWFAGCLADLFHPENETSFPL